VYNPDLLRGTICFHPNEQADFAYLKSWGLVDVFRKMNPEGNYYSWWDYRAGGYPRNHGMRLDHILVTIPLADACVSCGIDREPRGWDRPSDHAPVYAEFSGFGG
jgi:exodeoxyribonuclease-3